MEWIFQNKLVRNANFSPALVLRVVSVGLSFPPPASDSNSQTVGSLDPCATCEKHVYLDYTSLGFINESMH